LTLASRVSRPAPGRGGGGNSTRLAPQVLNLTRHKLGVRSAVVVMGLACGTGFRHCIEGVPSVASDPAPRAHNPIHHGAYIATHAHPVGGSITRRRLRLPRWTRSAARRAVGVSSGSTGLEVLGASACGGAAPHARLALEVIPRVALEGAGASGGDCGIGNRRARLAEEAVVGVRLRKVTEGAGGHLALLALDLGWIIELPDERSTPGCT
jgi:hypothetical protein